MWVMGGVIGWTLTFCTENFKWRAIGYATAVEHADADSEDCDEDEDADNGGVGEGKADVEYKGG